MKKALVVGLNNYKTAPLHGCINDALEIAKILERNADGSPNFDVKLVIDKDGLVNRADIHHAIEKLFSGDDTVLLYFSGHGLVNVYGGFIVTPDFEKYSEGIRMDDILNLANNSKARNKFIILDCCYSGAFGNPAINEAHTQLGQGVTILTACKSDESAFETSGRGIFTNLLIEALEGGAADLSGNVTAGSIYWFVDKALGPWEQRPVFKTNVNSYAPLRTLEPPIPLDVLRRIPVYFKEPDASYPLDPTYEETESCAIPENVIIFKELKKYQTVGLIKLDEGHDLYWVALHSKSCRLTALGMCYWRFVSEKRI